MDKQSSISLQRGPPYLCLPASSGDFAPLPIAIPWTMKRDAGTSVGVHCHLTTVLHSSSFPIALIVQTWTSFPFSLFPAVQTSTNVRWCRTSALMASVSTPWAPSGASARLATPPTSAGQLASVRGGCTQRGWQLLLPPDQVQSVERLSMPLPLKDAGLVKGAMLNDGVLAFHLLVWGAGSAPPRILCHQGNLKIEKMCF